MNLLIDAGFGTVEATYISTDRGESFININKDFNNEQVMSFCVNIAEDLYMTTTSGMIYRAISSKNLKTPEILGIEDNAVDVDVDAEFKWTSVERAELYQLQISYNDDFSSQWEHVTQNDTIHNLFLAPLNNYKYYWRVRAKNHDAVSEWSPVRSFYSKLAHPELLTPSDQEINVPVYANLNWKKVEAATQYLIQISNTNDFANIEHEWVSDDSLTTSPLLQGRTKYFWRVKAYNDMSTSNWSVVWSFETVFGPPELLSPLNEASGVSNTPEMRWKSAIDISEYDIQISLFQDFSEIAFSSNSIPDTSIIAESLLFDTVYYWRVRSSNNEAKSEWSLVWQFRTGYSPVELVSPNNDAVNVAINTEYLWTAHSSQNKYEIEVSKVNNFVNKVISDSIENNVTYIASNLESYHEYYWRVRVKSDFNTGVWSEIRKYKTKVGQIELRFPGNTSQNHPVSISFLWFQTKGATSYHLQIANDLLFNDLIFSQDTISKTSHLYNQLNGGSEYFWRVRAVSPEGVGDWSEVWSFRTGNDIPVLISPENGNSNIINPIKFEWAPVMGVIKYELTVSENSNFSSPIINETNIINNYYTTSELDYPKVFYWRIRAITDNGTSSWSQTWSFGTKDPLSVNNKILVEINEIYPNPTDKFVTIRLPQTISENSNLDIFDISGNKVYHKILNGINDEIKVDCSELSTGKYFVIIESADSLFNAEFMIIR
jgi:hypothetical protein